jgi:hypothetical protein
MLERAASRQNAWPIKNLRRPLGVGNLFNCEKIFVNLYATRRRLDKLCFRLVIMRISSNRSIIQCKAWAVPWRELVRAG